jgi:hypothetical protein
VGPLAVGRDGADVRRGRRHRAATSCSPSSSTWPSRSSS